MNNSPIHAIQSSKLLILLLLGRCNNKCRFCMVEGEVNTCDDLPDEVALRLIQKQSKDSTIEFFGGEPTLHPNFLTLIEYARHRGHACSIATNGRIFVSEKYTAALARLDPGKIYIRTSIYGIDEATHDYYTRGKGSYRQTIAGLRNIIKYGFPCQVNIVIMRGNYHTLGSLVDQIAELGVPKIKFSMLINNPAQDEHTVQISMIRPHLDEAIKSALKKTMQVTIEKAPFCLAPDFVSHFCCERQIAPQDRVYFLDGPCSACILANWCPGLDPFYARTYGGSELVPIQTVPSDQVIWLDKKEIPMLQPEFFRINFLVLQPDWLDNVSQLRDLALLKGRILDNLGELALIPISFIRQVHPQETGKQVRLAKPA